MIISKKQLECIVLKAKYDLLEEIADRADKIHTNSMELDYGKAVMELVCKYGNNEQNKIENPA